MALARPTAFPRWNTGGANRTEPTSGKKDTGWVTDEQPPSDFFNWIQHFGGLWDEWINERMFDGLIGGGGDEEDLLITTPTPATDGGRLSLKAADGAGAGDAGGDWRAEAGVGTGVGPGGSMTMQSGDSAGAVPGGDIDLLAGDSAGDDGGAVNLLGGEGGVNGGDVSVTGGEGFGGSGGDATLRGGDNAGVSGGNATVEGGYSSGTDIPGGNVAILAGRATGDAAANVSISAVDANQGAGTTQRPSTSYFTASGSLIRNLFDKALQLTGLSADPATPTAGDLFHRTADGKLWYYNGTFWQAATPLIFRQVAASNTVANTTSETAFDQFATIPANTLRVGSIIRVKGLTIVDAQTASATLFIRLRVGDQSAPSGVLLMAVNPGSPITGQIFTYSFELTMRTIGAAGTWRSFGYQVADVSSTTPAVECSENDSSAGTLDTTGALDVFASAQWGTADAGDQVTQHMFNVEVV